MCHALKPSVQLVVVDADRQVGIDRNQINAVSVGSIFQEWVAVPATLPNARVFSMASRLWSSALSKSNRHRTHGLQTHC